MNQDPEFVPRLRNVEPVPMVVDGRRVIGLKDPLNLSDKTLLLDPSLIGVVAMFNGTNSLRDIQAELLRQTGSLVHIEELESVVNVLDQAFLLEGGNAGSAYKRKVDEYRKKPFRPASHAGMSYSDDPDTLHGELEGFFTGPDGPGLPDLFSEDRRCVGLIAPHIDIRSGGPCFAKGYHALGTGRPSDLYVILGTGHAGVERMFTAGTLDFQTPLGVVETDRDFVNAVSDELGWDVAAEEILHETEHVIEFQVIFLQKLFAGRHGFKIAPILCSLSHLFFQDSEDLAEMRADFARFCSALKKVCNSGSASVCFVASADLDHIGPRYGDSFTPHEGTVASALEEDRKLLETLERLDREAFIQGVAKDNDSRRICGFSPITTMLHCMDAEKGELLSLDYAFVDDRKSFVSFASMVFH